MTNILLEADTIVNGDRAKAYGDVHENFGRWSMLCHHVGIYLTPEQLAMIMALGKLARNAHSYKRDNIVDCAGYLELGSRLHDAAQLKTVNESVK